MFYSYFQVIEKTQKAYNHICPEDVYKLLALETYFV